MNLEEHYRTLERMYVAAPCNEYYGPKISISNGECNLVIPVQSKFFHAANAVHGSVYFKIMDDAGFFAANSLVTDVFVLTASFNIYFLKPISSGELRAHGKVVHASKRLFISESVLRNSEGEEIGRGSGTFIKSHIRLADIGYS